MAHWLMDHQVIQDMLKQVNYERSRYRLAPLTLDLKLSLVAQRHAQWMGKTGSYTHSRYGIPECLHHGPKSVRNCVNGWFWSSPHRRILLSGRKVGYGYDRTAYGTWWVAEVQ
jgi:uncharacterized protein YkwD